MKLICTLILSFFMLTAQAEVIRVATGDFPPYCSSSAKHKGFANHLISEALARQGYKVEFDFLPWKRAYKQARLGEYDASSWWTFKQERTEEFDYSDELLVSSIHFFYVRGKLYDFDWQKLTDLKGYRIGVSRAYHYSDQLVSFRAENPKMFEVVNSDEQNIRRLLKNRIDLFPVDTAVGLELLRTRFGPSTVHQINYHPRPLITRPGFVIFPKSKATSDKYRLAFNAGLKSMREDGTYSRMVDDLHSGYYSN